MADAQDQEIVSGRVPRSGGERLFEDRDGIVVLPGTIKSEAERVQVVGLSGRQRD